MFFLVLSGGRPTNRGGEISVSRSVDRLPGEIHTTGRCVYIGGSRQRFPPLCSNTCADTKNFFVNHCNKTPYEFQGVHFGRSASEPHVSMTAIPAPSLPSPEEELPAAAKQDHHRNNLLKQSQVVPAHCTGTQEHSRTLPSPPNRGQVDIPSTEIPQRGQTPDRLTS